MEVLMQHWLRGGYRSMVSISKDKEQLETTLQRHKEDDDVKADGECETVQISDDSMFAEMVENDTVFLHDDEMDCIIYPDGWLST